MFKPSAGPFLFAGLFFSLCLPASPQQTGRSDWSSLDRQAEDFYTKGDLKQAIRIARLAVEASTGPHETGHSLDRLGFFEYTGGSLKDGESDLRRALQLRHDQIGVDTTDYAESANDLALLCRDSGKLPEARTLAEQAVQIRTRLLGPRDALVAESLNTLGSVVALLGEYDAAISRFEESLAIQDLRPAPRSEEYGTLCINLAGTYQRVGKYAKAEAMFEKGLDVLRVKPGVNHPAYSASLVAYAYLQADLGRYSSAEKLYAESGRLLREQLGENHAVYATFLNNRAALYAALGNVAVAEADYRKSLELKRKLYGPDAVTIGASLRNLARLVAARNPAESEKLFQEAVDLYSRNAKPPPFDYASALLGLAEAQRAHGDLAAARATLDHASSVVIKGLGANHPLYAAVLRDRGLVHQSAGEYHDSERLLQQAVEVVRQAQGEDHPDLAQYLERLASVYEQAGDYGAALPLYRRGLDISTRALADMLSVGSVSNKTAAAATVADSVSRLVLFQRKAGPQFPAARALAFEAVARGKGRVLDEVHDWGRSLRENPNAAIRRRFTQREALLGCEASLTTALGYRDLKPAVVGSCSLPGTALEGRYERLLNDLRTRWTESSGRTGLLAVHDLRQRIEALETGLSRENTQFSSVIRLMRMKDIQARLRPGELLIECIAYREPGARAEDRRYGAFLLDREGALAWTDLGPAAPLDEAVKDLITAANDWSISAALREQSGVNSAAQTANDALRMLSEKLRPITAELARRKGIDHLRVAPDGMLNLIPLAALKDSRGRFLIERYAISYISAGRDLAGPEQPQTGEGHPPRSVIAVSPGAGPSRPAGTSEVAQSFRAARLERLAYAEREARDVQRWLPNAQLLSEGQATERRIKQLRGPVVLHIVGHGIVRGNEDCRAAPTSPGCQLAAIDPAARVMGLSAIVLEEAYGRGGASAEDGLLTALELQTLDLEGTQMLVLSQCRMADGIPTSGEGVYGMRRAAAIAGVSTLVAPLWKVADDAERALMERFYRELAAGAGRADALRRAQLELLRSSGRDGFLIWAPVILFGDPAALPSPLFKRHGKA